MIPLNRSGSSLFVDLLFESFNDEVIIVFSWSLGEFFVEGCEALLFDTERFRRALIEVLI